MPEPQIYTTYRGWPITRKASSPSETRDWYSEHVTFCQSIDDDVDKLSPAGQVFMVRPTPGDPVSSGTELLAASAAAKAANPTADKPAVVYIHPGVYDLGVSSLVCDTDYILYYCPAQARRNQWTAEPAWSDVQQAGAKIVSGNNPGQGAIFVTAQHVVLVGLHSEYSGSVSYPGYGTTILQVAVDSATDGPVLIGCSFSQYMECRTPATVYMRDCHAEMGIGGTDYGSSGVISGIIERCSASGGRSITQGGFAHPLTVRNCLIKYENNGWGGATLGDVVFDSCRIYGTFPWNISTTDSGENSNNTVFRGCYIECDGFGGIQATGLANKYQLIGCTVRTGFAVAIADGGSLVDCDISGPDGGTMVQVGIGHGPIRGCRIHCGGVGEGIVPFEDITGQPSGEISNNIIRVGGTPIDSGVPWVGGNLLDGIWTDTGGGGGGSSTGYQVYEGRMLGQASSTDALLCLSPTSTNNPGGIPLTTPYDTYQNGGCAPFIAHGDQTLVACRVSCAAAAVAQGTVGPSPAITVSIYSHDATSRTLIANVSVPIDNPADVGVYNNLGGTGNMVTAYLDMEPLAINVPDKTMFGFQVYSQTGNNNQIAGVSVVTVSLVGRATT